MSNELKEALGLVQECLDDWHYAATRVIPIMHRLEKVKELLLKEQEAVPVIQREIAHMFFWCCGSCGVAITDGDKFCRNCGKAVKWNDEGS